MCQTFSRGPEKLSKGLSIGHSEVFEKMTDEWPSLMATGDKIVPIIAFGGRFIVELPPRCTWLTQETSEILPEGVIIYKVGLLCEGRAGAGVFSGTLDIRESYALGSLATVFQTIYVIYAILACSKISLIAKG
jgi:hypothetical protein